MNVLKENLGGIVVLTLKGEFDTFVTGAFSNEITNCLSEGAHSIVLNMRLVKFVNSTALGSMIKARKQCLAAHAGARRTRRQSGPARPGLARSRDPGRAAPGHRVYPRARARAAL